MRVFWGCLMRATNEGYQWDGWSGVGGLVDGF